MLVAFVALAFVISHTQRRGLQDALAHAPLLPLLGVSIVMSVLNCAADTLAMFYVFRWFGLRLRFLDLYTIRAATYLLAVINYHAGQVGIIGFLHRVGRVPLARASGWILFIVGVWVGLLLLFASAGAFLGGRQGQALTPVLLLFGAGMVAYVLLLFLRPRWLTEAPEGSPRSRVLGRLRRVGTALFAPLLDAGIPGHARALLVRLPHLLVLLLWHYIALRCFRVEVPFPTAMLYLPVVFAVASLPISVQGLGTSQIAAVYFFQSFARGGKEAIVAYSLSMTAISMASNLLLGFLFLRRAAALGLKSDEIEDDKPRTEGAALPLL